MRNPIVGLALTALIPLAACDAGGEQMGDAELGQEVETAPATDAATEQTGLAEWDTDTNQELNRQEWDAWYADQGTSDQWNTDAEEGLTQDELGTGAYGLWDADGDDSLTESEWNEGMGTWFGDQDYGAWSEWDANGDSALDANEVTEGLEREGLYDTVDRDSDALVDDEELADWWFDIWDGNDDQIIDTTEWDQVGAEWSRMGAGTGMGTGM